MKVLVSLNIPDIGIKMMEKEGLEVQKWTEDNPMPENQFKKAVKNCDALLTGGTFASDAEFLENNKHLKIISKFAVGYDDIDIAAATRLGIPIANAPNAMADATADIAFALLLATSRKMFFRHKSIIAGDWKGFHPQSHLGIELKNKTVGIFGLGTIGLEFAKRCRGAYNMEVLYCNRSHNQKAEQEVDAKKVSFDELLKKSDIISAHCALTGETKGKFNAEAFKKMKNSAIFVNSSRGQVHNQPDLIEALKNGDIWGAGLDVTDPEPMDKDNPLLSMANVSVTPHIGSATVEARNRMSEYAAENIIACFKGKKIPYLVNEELRKD